MEANRVAPDRRRSSPPTSSSARASRSADVVISPSAYMVDWMQDRGWTLPERVFVQQYVRSRVVAETAADAERTAEAARRRPTPAGSEIVFFGRLETRKGIELFCDALDRLADEGALPGASVAFMGKQTRDRRAAAEHYLRKAGRRMAVAVARTRRLRPARGGRLPARHGTAPGAWP